MHKVRSATASGVESHFIANAYLAHDPFRRSLLQHWFSAVLLKLPRIMISPYCTVLLHLTYLGTVDCSSGVSPAKPKAPNWDLHFLTRTVECVV